MPEYSANRTTCELCRTEPAASFHHLIPRTVHRNKWFRKRFSRDDMQRGIDLCSACHHAVHEFIPDNKELARDFRSTESLRNHPQLARFLEWKRRR